MASSGARGRLDLEAQIAAIGRAVALKHRVVEVRAALDRVTTGSAFRGSRRAQEFLRYTVEQALAGQLDQLRERSIAVALFGRDPSYDTRSDAVVRVSANDVRKRLASHYQQTPGARVVFDILPGTYIPNIRFTEAVEPSGPASPAPTLPVPSLVSVPAVSRSPWWIAAVAGWTLALVLAGAWMLSLSEPRTTLPESRPRQLLPWVALSRQGASPQQLILTDSVAGKSGARIAAGLGQIGFHHGSFVLPGGRDTNPWVRVVEEQLDFSVSLDPAGCRHSIRIRNPRPGEPKELIPGAGETYAILALVSVPGDKGRVLLMEDTGEEGSAYVGQVALDPEWLAQELAACGIQPDKPGLRFELLLKLRTSGGESHLAGVVASRCSP